jgi:TrmH family RNA methyltransferase
VITSTANKNVKYVRSLHRRSVRHRERRFVLEGVRLVEEMIKAGQEPVFFFCTEDVGADSRGASLVNEVRSSGVEAQSVTENVMQAMSDTKTPQGVLAVADFPRVESVGSNLGLVLDRVRDPGNLGTILRTAEAAGVGVVFTVRGSVDVYSPKVVRGAMGAHFRLPIMADSRWKDIRTAVEGAHVLLAVPRGGSPYYDVDWTLPTTLVMGGEAEGAGPRARELATGAVSIPMATGVESLNVAVATGILLFEAARQRREARSA